MSGFRAALFAALVIFGAVLAVPFAGALAPTDAAATAAQSDGTNETDAANRSTIGAQMSSFMQISSANATSAVESGMFEAEYETADNRTAVVDRRADRIERQIERLRDRKQRLAEREGEMSDVAYTAQMSRIVGEIEALEREINATEPKARAAGVDTARFDRLRGNVSDLRGPKVDEFADAIPGRGPPADAGQPDTPGQGDGGAGDGTPANDAPNNGSASDATPGRSEDRAGNEPGPPSGGDGGPGNGGGDGKTDNGGGGPVDDLPYLTVVWW